LKAAGNFENPILTLNNLSISFSHEGEQQIAVDHISFELQRGSTLGIVGESGSGKSVTSLAIMGLVPKPGGIIDSGSIIFQTSEGVKTDLMKFPEKEMRLWRGKRIAMIFQEPMTSLNPVYRCGKQVMENILEHEKVSRSEARRRTIDLFREVMLPDPESTFNAYPHQVSGGQKQRVMIAMALACNPDILIADEPTTALDVTVQKNILELLHLLQKKHNISLIFISHNLDVIAEIASQVIVMYKGQIVERGSIEQIFNHPQHPYTKGLLACRPPLGERPQRLRVIADFTNGSGNITDQFISKSERAGQHKKLFATAPVLKAEGINTIFTLKQNLAGKPIRQFKAVNNVSFDVYPGETLGLVGESGCGKTTLGRTILRLIEPDSGNIVYKDIQVNKLKPDDLRNIRKKLQIIFQDPYSSLNPRITIGEAIIEPMRIHNMHGSEKLRKAKVAELLQKVGLETSHYGRYPHEFSGGQRQRICIARALAVEPEFIICDESVSALDVSVQAQVLNLLNDLKKEFGLTYLFISHDLSVVRYMSDRLMVMHNGEIQEMGEADEVFTNPKSAYTRSLLEAIPKGCIGRGKRNEGRGESIENGNQGL
jgi:peptide/nickel transport system ATP-binding protein